MTGTETGWTKFSDKLPEAGQLILVRGLNGFEAHIWGKSLKQYVTTDLWQPLFTESEVQARELAARRMDLEQESMQTQYQNILKHI